MKQGQKRSEKLKVFPHDKDTREVSLFDSHVLALRIVSPTGSKESLFVKQPGEPQRVALYLSGKTELKYKNEKSEWTTDIKVAEDITISSTFPYVEYDTLKRTTLEDAEWLCVHVFKVEPIVSAEHVKYTTKDKIMFPKTDRQATLFIISGTIELNGETIVGPASVRHDAGQDEESMKVLTDVDAIMIYGVAKE